MLDGDGNLRAADIGIPLEGNKTFLHGVRVVGSNCPRPVMSAPYPQRRDSDRNNTSTTAQPPTPVTPVTTPDADARIHRFSLETCQGYRPAAPIQRFNNKSLNWLAWFRHFRAVADVHGWTDEQRALQLVSYLDDTAINVAHELGDSDLYNYDVLVKLLSNRFDPVSSVSAFRSRFHGRLRRHHEDADAFADVLPELCRVGYPQSSPELRQELIAEQFVRGQSDPELKKYLWVVIRTQKDKKLQTLIEVCIYFSSLSTPTHLHQPTEQTFAVHQQVETPLPYAEECADSEDVFAMGDRAPWINRRAPEPTAAPTLQQMFTLARRMGYEMRPIAGQPDAQRQPLANQPFQIRTGDSVLKRGPVGTTPRLSASVMDNLDICRPVARDRTLRCRLIQGDGIFNPTVVNSGMGVTSRKTLHRPGPHPHRSVRIRSPIHLHSPHRLRLLQHRIILFINNLPHAHHLRIGIILRHRMCLLTTLWMGHRCPVRLFSPCHWTRLNRNR